MAKTASTDTVIVRRDNGVTSTQPPWQIAVSIPRLSTELAGFEPTGTTLEIVRAYIDDVNASPPVLKVVNDSQTGYDSIGGVTAEQLTTLNNAVVTASPVLMPAGATPTVEPFKTYTLNANTSYAGLVGLLNGQFVDVLMPVTSTATLEHGTDVSAVTGANNFSLDGNASRVLKSGDKQIIRLTRIGNSIRANARYTADEIRSLVDGASDSNVFTDALKSKLDQLQDASFKGQFANLGALAAAYPGPNDPGSAADVEPATPGDPLDRYVWSVENNVWELSSGTIAGDTAASVKTKYETNPDTNAFTDADKAKLSAVEAGAQVNPTGDAIATAYEMEPDRNRFSDADKAKVDGIEAGATTDQTGAEIRSLLEAEPDTHTLSDARLAMVEVAQQTSAKGQAGGYASLDANSRIPLSQLPEGLQGQYRLQGFDPASDDLTAITQRPDGSVLQHNDYVELTADGEITVEGETITTAKRGDRIVYYAAPAPAAWSYVNRRATAEEIGLGNVDNTADLDKPVSAPQQDAINAAVRKAATLTALAALSVTGLANEATAQVESPQRGGEFVWDGSDLSTEVGYETPDFESVFIAPTSDPTGASGAWVRKSFLETGGVNVAHFGATANDSAADAETNRSAIQAAIEIAEKTGRKKVYLPRQLSITYQVSGPLRVTVDDMHIDADKDVRIKKGQNDINLFHVGKAAWTDTGATGSVEDNTWSTARTLSADAKAGDLTITLASVAGLVENEDYAIRSQAPSPGDPAQKTGDFIKIRSISGTTVTLHEPLRFDFNTADTAEVMDVDWVTGLRLTNITFDGADFNSSVNSNQNNAIRMFAVRDAIIENCGVVNNTNVGFGLNSCLRVTFNNPRFINLWSDDSFNFGYGICPLGLNKGIEVYGIFADRTRHPITTARLGSEYGEDIGLHAKGGLIFNSHRAAIDNHPMGIDQTFEGWVCIGGSQSAIQLRATNTKVINCIVEGFIGAAVHAVSMADGALIENLTARLTNQGTADGVSPNDWTTRAAIYIEAPNVRVKGGEIDRPKGSGYQTFSGALNPYIEGTKFTNVREGGVAGFVVNFGGTDATTMIARNITASNDNGHVTTSFQTTNTLGKTFMSGCYATGYTVKDYGSAAGAHLSINGGPGPWLNSHGEFESVSIVEGVVDISAIESAAIKVSGEGGVADTLDLINLNPVDGAYIFVRRDGHNITLKHRASGTGRLNLRDQTDIVLTKDTDLVVFYGNTTEWIEIARFVATEGSGVFTPSLVVASPGDIVITPTVQYGYYRKDGDAVYYEISLTFDTNPYTHTEGGDLTITGLPFTNASAIKTPSGGPVMNMIVWPKRKVAYGPLTTDAPVDGVVAAVKPSSSDIALYAVESGRNPVSLDANAIPANKDNYKIEISGTMRAAA